VVAEDFADKGVEAGKAGGGNGCAGVGGLLGGFGGSEFGADGGQEGGGFDEMEQGEVGYRDGVEV
jgi:hypothetical protein